jgi:hypothetical protein
MWGELSHTHQQTRMADGEWPLHRVSIIDWIHLESPVANMTD